MNTIGKLLTLNTFGESHGPAMGGVLDGMPAGLDIDLDALQRFVDRRRTGQAIGSSKRVERDRVELLSGIWQGKTLGTPIGFIVRNTDAHSDDYNEIAQCYRPNHADYTWEKKYGLNPNDPSDAIKDCNGDGYTNIEKYINGINPKKKVDWTNPKNNHDTLADRKSLL